MDKIIYTKFSNDRATQYMIATDIIAYDDQRIVRKRAASKEAIKHVLNANEQCKKLEKTLQNTGFVVNKIIGSGMDYVDFEYIEGQSFEQFLDQMLDEDDFQQLIESINSFYIELKKIDTVPFKNNDVFNLFFGMTEEIEGYESIPVGNVDLIFQNIIIDKDNKWNVIDYEWTFDCAIPLKFLMYRSIYLYVYGQSRRSCLIDKNLYQYFDISEKDIRIFSKMEDHFQSTIKAGHKNLGDYYHYMGKPGDNNAISVSQNERRNMVIYYDLGDGFNEQTKEEYTSHEVVINLPQEVKAVRIDPMSVDCMVRVERIKDDNNYSLDYSSNGELLNSGSYLFVTSDPYFEINNIPANCKYIDVSLKVTELSHFEEKEIIMYNDELNNKTNELNNKTNELNNITNELNNKTNELNNKTNELNNITNELNSKSNDLAAVYNSLSWKITKPMRSIGGAIYGFMRRHRVTSVFMDGMISLRHNGVISTYRRVIEFCFHPKPVMDEDYYELTKEQILMQKKYQFDYRPLISILVPLYNTPEDFLKEMIDSVVEQTYDNWELCLADGSDDNHSYVGDVCRQYIKDNVSIVYKHLDKNLGISENTNACLEMASGDFIGLFDHDDLLTQDALFEIVKRINEDDKVDVLYTDEDKYLYDSKKQSGSYVEPHYKSDFNLDLLRTNNYICHFFVVKKSIVDEIGGFRSEYDGSQDYDFILRCVEKANKIEHIDKILYHWRIHANSTASKPESKMYCYEAGKRAIQSHLKRMKIIADVEMTEHLGFYRVHYQISDNPLVSIIIPNKDEKNTLKKCIDSIVKKSSYDNYEIIIVENNSETAEIFQYYDEISDDKRIHVVYWKHEFNYSKINNFGVTKAKGNYLLLLNNDVEIITNNWIEEMLSNCQRKEVGITGAKLLYNDNTVQHGGVIIGLGGIAGHAFCGLDANHPGYFGRAYVQQNLSAVTAACLMVRREVFEEVNGLEESLRVAFNDVDFCLKVRSRGYLVVMNPNVKLYHYESKTRGMEDTPEKLKRFESEVRYMAENWTTILQNGDPYYNKNLTLVRGDFSVKGKDEVAPKYV